MAGGICAGLQSCSSIRTCFQQHDRASALTRQLANMLTGLSSSCRWCSTRGIYRLLHESSICESSRQRICLWSGAYNDLKPGADSELFLSLASLFNAHLLPRALSTSPETLLTTMALYYYPLPGGGSGGLVTSKADDPQKETAQDSSSATVDAGRTCGAMDRDEGRDWGYVQSE